MNRESLAKTAATGERNYWSRSRMRLGKRRAVRKRAGTVREIRLDCDEDVVLLRVEQSGGKSPAHTGRHSCFSRSSTTGAG